ncbi:MAG: hypothetical protein J7M18_02580 [Candidatus Eremiobacteraeota bacterium]|nr:hypothetical protein [Candidatus Eremiobacteraeota bacterium]
MKKISHLLIICSLVISMLLFITTGDLNAEDQSRNVILVIARVKNKNFQIWKKEFLRVFDEYFDELPGPVIKQLNMARSASVLNINATGDKQEKILEIFQRALGLSKKEPFIGFVEVQWVKTEHGWAPGRLSASRTVVKLPSDRPGYNIAAGRSGNAKPGTIRKIAGEDFRYLLRELYFKLSP